LERSSPAITTTANEEFWLLVGERRGNVYLARLLDRTMGRPEAVEFDALAALTREEREGDVIGFLHTHPSCEATLSRRDVNTMRAWVSSFGKPLLCVIEGTDGLRAYLFEDYQSSGRQLSLVERFSDDTLVVVDHS
jgi:proteasome lid subunit RPN8/RPN11